MVKSRKFDLVCILAVIAALVITILFMNGEALGITPVTTEDNWSGYFTDNDLMSNWSTASATVITLNGDDGTVEGNGAYIYDGDVYIVYAGYYVITGELNDGAVIVDADGDDKLWIQLNNASLHCEDGAAFVVENADKVFLTLAEGSTNTISDGEEYSEENIEDGMTGAIFSHDDLTINGSGSLTVTGNYRHGIVAKDDMVFTGGEITITAKEDAVHANDSVRITQASLTIDAGDDGITVSNDDATDYVYIESGTVTVNSCYEGLEGNCVMVAGGSVTIYPSDDGINATGSDGVIEISGGEVTVINTSAMDADGFDSNGSIRITGGTVFVSVPGNGACCALDYGSENGGELVIDGGSVIAAGGSSMMEEVSSASQQGFVVYTGDTLAADTAVSLQTEDGEELMNAQIPVTFSALILSCSGMENGLSYILETEEGQTTLTAGESSSSFGGFGMGGGGFNMGGGHGRSDAAGFGTSEDADSENAENVEEGSTEEGSTEEGSTEEGSTEEDSIEEGSAEETAAEGQMQRPDQENRPDDSTQGAQNTANESADGQGTANSTQDVQTTSDVSEDAQPVADDAQDTQTTADDSQDDQTTADGRQMPGGGFGGGMPDGMSSGDMEMPEDMTEPDWSDMEMPEGMTEPDWSNMEMPEDMTMPSGEMDEEDRENFAQQMGNGGGGGMGMPGFEGTDSEEETQITVNSTTWVLIGLSVIVLAFGLIFAFCKKGKQ